MYDEIQIFMAFAFIFIVTIQLSKVFIKTVDFYSTKYLLSKAE